MTDAADQGDAALLRWQLDVAWALAEYHLERLEPDDLLWEPSAHCWTLRPGPAGAWVADFAETEPDPIPTPTIAWTTWHIGWWWSTALAHLEGRAAPDVSEIAWPGTVEAVVAWLRELHAGWTEALARQAQDLARPAAFPWPAEDGRTLAHMAAWVNVELTKNVAEIGQVRMLRAARGSA